MTKTRRVAAIVAGTGLALSLVSATQGSASALDIQAGTSAWAQGWSSLPASVGNNLFHGTVRAAGKSSSGATVVLFGVPNPTSSAPEAAEQPLVRTTSDTTGAWGLSVPAGLDLAPYADNGVANFEIVSFDGHGSDVYFSSATSKTVAAKAALSSAGLIAGRLGKKNVGLTPVDSTAIALDSDRIPDRPGAGLSPQNLAAPADGPISIGCTNSDYKSYPNTAVQVAATYSDGKGDYFRLTYTKGANSSLGVATSEGGEAFKQSGTTSKSSSSTQGFPTVKNVANRAYFTYFTYRRYKQHCVEKQRGQVIDQWTNTIFAPYTYDGGDKVSKVATIKAGQCIPEVKGGHFDLGRTKATTFSVGVKSSGPIGIDLSADTGYSTNTDIDAEFPGTGHPLCGLKGKPGNSPGLLQIHSTVVK